MLGKKLGGMQFAIHWESQKKLAKLQNFFAGFCNYVQVTFFGNIGFKLDSCESESIELG
jgi:hypothetical protein